MVLLYSMSYRCLFFFKDDDEGHLTAFHCVEDLMSKGKDIFLVHFVRLGVLNRIQEISESHEKKDLDRPDSSSTTVRRCAIVLFENMQLFLICRGSQGH